MNHHEKKNPVTSTPSTRSGRPLPRLSDLPACTKLLALGYTAEYARNLTVSDLRRCLESSPASGNAPIEQADAPDGSKEDRPLRSCVETASELLLSPRTIAHRAFGKRRQRRAMLESGQRSDLGFLAAATGSVHETSRVSAGADPAGYPAHSTPGACAATFLQHLAAAAGQRSAHRWSVLVSKSDGTLGVEEAARVCGVSDETIRRRLRAGRFAGAHREGGVASAWRIPVADLLAEGFRPRFESEGTTLMPPEELEELRRELAVARAIADERAARIAHLEAQLTALTAVVQTIGATR